MFLSAILLTGLLTIVSVVVAFPHRQARHISRPSPRSIIVTFSQSTNYGLNRTMTGRTGQCTDVVDVNTPTLITIGRNSMSSFQLVTYSTSCTDLEHEVIGSHVLDNFAKVVNERSSICSFKVQDDQQTSYSNSATVEFHSGHPQTSGNGHSQKTRVHHGTCINICTGNTWARFARTVSIRESNKPVSKYIDLFSDSHCHTLLAADVPGGSDLVDLTRVDKDPSKVVRSFVIVPHHHHD